MLKFFRKSAQNAIEIGQRWRWIVENVIKIVQNGKEVDQFLWKLPKIKLKFMKY